jgi:hypothetical protein
MQDAPNSLEESLAGLDRDAWRAGMERIADDNGMFQPLGDRHFATFIDEKPILLVTFETVQGIRALSDTAQPLGFDMVKALGWSHLCIVSDGDTWFREPRVYGFFDQLIDDGFFEDFERVIFYGAGPCGYAAAAFSVASPDATVVAVQPQATLDPRVTEWDPRFTEMRRTSFTDRYGYAPDMLDAADRAFVLYDPREDLDAMHSALFHRPGVTRLRTAHLGSAIQTGLIEMKLLYRILAQAGSGKLSAQSFARMYRARRDHPPYLRSLMARLDRDDRPWLNAMLCRNVTARLRAPKFRRRLEALEAQAEAGEIEIPPRRG